MKVKAENMTRELEPGDIITVKGISYKIKEVLSQDFYKCEYEDQGGTSYIFIEFTDIKGSYHYWKSSSDGGEFTYKEDIKNIDKVKTSLYVKTRDLLSSHSIKYTRGKLKDSGYTDEEVDKSILDYLCEVDAYL